MQTQASQARPTFRETAGSPRSSARRTGHSNAPAREISSIYERLKRASPACAPNTARSRPAAFHAPLASVGGTENAIGGARLGSAADCAETKKAPIPRSFLKLAERVADEQNLCLKSEHLTHPEKTHKFNALFQVNWPAFAGQQIKMSLQ